MGNKKLDYAGSSQFEVLQERLSQLEHKNSVVEQLEAKSFRMNDTLKDLQNEWAATCGFVFEVCSFSAPVDTVLFRLKIMEQDRNAAVETARKLGAQLSDKDNAMFVWLYWLCDSNKGVAFADLVWRRMSALRGSGAPRCNARKTNCCFSWKATELNWRGFPTWNKWFELSLFHNRYFDRGHFIGEECVAAKSRRAEEPGGRLRVESWRYGHENKTVCARSN